MLSPDLSSMRARIDAHVAALTPAQKKAGAVAAGVAAGAAAYGAYRLLTRAPRKGRFPRATLPDGEHIFDAIVVGAGPAGATAAFYASRGGVPKVCLLDRHKFPRDKICGDAVCTPALRILDDMGVLDELKAADEIKMADAGGFVSPCGNAYIGASKKVLGGAAAGACKRTHLDARVARAAARAPGVTLREGYDVDPAGVSFDAESGLWTVTAVKNKGPTLRARLLIIADGATSRLATALGHVVAPPAGVCSRAYVEGGTHNAKFDGVCFYRRESLPGYAALFKHPRDELGYCYYLLPSGKKTGQCGDVTEADLPRLHADALKHDPFIAAAVGRGKVGRMRAGPLRLGFQGVARQSGDHFLIVGDAAGHVDPLTGEGIHTAMLAGRAAGAAAAAMVGSGDYSARSTRALYDRAVWRAFAHDFGASRAAASLIYKFPILLDAAAAEMRRVGDPLMAKWAEVMTCMRPKTYFLRPDVGLPLAVAVVKQAVAGSGRKEGAVAGVGGVAK